MQLDERLKTLIELQKIDMAVRELEGRYRQIPREIEKLEQALAESGTVLSEYRKRLEEIERTRRGKERDIEANNERAKKHESQLYVLKSNKDYQAMIGQIEELKMANSLLDDEVLQLLDELDQLKSTIAGKEAEFEDEKRRIQEETAELNRQLQAIGRELEARRQTRAQVVKHVEKPLLERYMRIAKVRHNAVVPLKSSACSGCFMMIRPAVLTKVRSGSSIVTCDACNRILYFEEEP